MKLKVFYLAYGFLVFAFLFHLAGLCTNDWWRSGSDSFSAGLWRVCVGGTELRCVEYMRVFDTSINGTAVYTTIGGLSSGYRRQLNLVRTLVLLYVIVVTSLFLVTSLIFFFICRGSKIAFPRWLKLSMILSETFSIGVGVGSLTISTQYDNMFSYEDIKLSASWFCIAFSNLANIFSAIFFGLIFISDYSQLKEHKRNKTMRFGNKEMVRRLPDVKVAIAAAAKATEVECTVQLTCPEYPKRTVPEYPELDVTNQLEWDDSNWKIDEYNVKQTKTTVTTTTKIEETRTETRVLPSRKESVKQSTPVRKDSVQQDTPARKDSVKQGIPVRKDSVKQGITVRKDSVKQAIPVRQDSVKQNIPVRKDSVRQAIPVRKGQVKQNIPVQKDSVNRNTPVRKLSVKRTSPVRKNSVKPDNVAQPGKVSLELFSGTTNDPVQRQLSGLTSLALFSEVDLGRLQSESFRNKSIRVKSSSFANPIVFQKGIHQSPVIKT